MNALLFTALILSQPPSVPGYGGPPSVPDYKIVSFQEYPKLTPLQLAVNEADAKKMPLVIFVGVPSRLIAGCVVVRDDSWQSKACVTVHTFAGSGLRFAYDVDDATIRRAAGLVVSQQSAVPFVQPAAQRPIADDSPWLSRAESAAVKQAWPKSLAFPASLKFYSLPARYQRLYTMNNGAFKGRDIVDLHDQSAAMAHSGGMEGITGWRSVKGLAIPGDKRISVWEEDTDVRAFALVPRWRWSFPSGTVAFDVLLNDAGKPFEIRTAEKTDDGEWAMRVAFRDKDQSPKGYAGINRSCRDCHSQPGAVMDVPGQIYRHVMWGSDQRFSWRPYTDSNTLDMRWPIERK